MKPKIKNKKKKEKLYNFTLRCSIKKLNYAMQEIYSLSKILIFKICVLDFANCRRKKMEHIKNLAWPEETLNLH